MLQLTEVLDSVLRNLAEANDGSQYWLGVDGGGTNTRAMLFRAPADSDVDLSACLVGAGRAAAANFHRVGVEAATKSILTAVTQACRQAKITPHQITAACLGLAGVSHPDNHRKMYDAIDDAGSAAQEAQTQVGRARRLSEVGSRRTTRSRRRGWRWQRYPARCCPTTSLLS